MGVTHLICQCEQVQIEGRTYTRSERGEERKDYGDGCSATKLVKHTTNCRNVQVLKPETMEASLVHTCRTSRGRRPS